MSSIRKQILVDGQTHYIEVTSSLELEEVEVTGADPVSGKVVQVALSPMLKSAQRSQGPFSMAPMPPAPVWSGLGEQTQQAPASSPAPMDMFAEPSPESRINPPLSYNAIPAPPSGLFAQNQGQQQAPSGFAQAPAAQFPAQSQAPSLFDQTPVEEQTSLFTPQPAAASGLERLKQKSENQDVDDTLNGMYRY